MINNSKIQQTCELLAIDELIAWRHLRDQAILRRRYSYQLPSRYRGEGDN